MQHVVQILYSKAPRPSLVGGVYHLRFGMRYKHETRMKYAPLYSRITELFPLWHYTSSHLRHSGQAKMINQGLTRRGDTVYRPTPPGQLGVKYVHISGINTLSTTYLMFCSINSI